LASGLARRPNPNLLTLFRQLDAAAIRAHPDFRRAAELHSRLALDELSSRPGVRWLFKDIGRAAVLSRAMMAQAAIGHVTVADVLELTTQRNTSSLGRVVQVIKRAESAGMVTVAEGAGPWRRRHLLLRPELVEVYRGRAANELAAAAIVAPEVAPALEILREDRYLQAFLANLQGFDGMGPDLRGPPTPSIRAFLQHDSGLAMLRALLLQQPEGRARLLERAPFSGRALAKRALVSRSHVRRVFGEAAAAGRLAFVGRRMVAFSPQLSDEFEWFFAVTFQVIRATALAAMQATKNQAAVHRSVASAQVKNGQFPAAPDRG
jgi:hypothetical protein